MERVLLLQHLISQFWVDTFTVSAREVCWKERGLWTEQRRYEAFLQDRAVCPRCDTEMESEEHRLCVCEGNAEGDPDPLDIVAKTDWIVPEALEGLVKLALRSFSCVAWHQDLGCWRRPTIGQRFFWLLMLFTTVSILALAHTSLMAPNCILIRAVERLVGFFALS